MSKLSLALLGVSASLLHPPLPARRPHWQSHRIQSPTRPSGFELRAGGSVPTPQL